MIHSTENESNKSIWSHFKNNTGEKNRHTQKDTYSMVFFFFHLVIFFFFKEAKPVVSLVGEEAVFERERKEALRCHPPSTS